MNHTIDGYTISVHAIKHDYDRTWYGFSLILPDGTVLFNDHEKHYISVPNYTDATERAIMVAWEYVTMKYGDTDRDFFDNHTPDEIAWITSSACDMLYIEEI